ncbi:MAG: hypothetical protein IJL73_02435 [Lachnospiraceae bacterium]|nr:hypothetical protein [Lachnospiraceae bacterium]
MKKVLPFLAILLTLLLTFSSCAGCNQKTDEPTDATVETTEAPSKDPGTTEPEPGSSEDPGVVIDQEFVDKAADMIYEFYKPGKTNTVSADFTLPSKVKYQGVDVDVEWVVVSGDQYAKIGPADYENLINVIVNKSSGGGPFTIKGIVKAGNYTKEIEFNYELVSQYDLLVAAYALTGDQKIENSTLTGVISKVNTPYDAGYGNITVTIIVDGHDDMPIMCYRLKGDGVDTIKVGDTITVFGTLVNYNGTIEFTSGCTLVSIDNVGEEIPDDSPVFNSDREIVEAAYKLPANEYMSQTKTYTLTGKVTKVNTPYDDNYKNVTVTIVVDNMTDKPIQCYRMKGADADKVKVTDVIQVTGYLKNYVNSSGKSTIEFDAGCTLDKIVEVGSGEPKKNYGTDQQIVDAAYALAEGDNLIGEQTLTGTVTKVNTPYDPNFQNVTVTIVVSGREDKPIQCYRMKGDQANIVKVTDVIQVTGIIKNYVNSSGKSTIEFDAGCHLDKIVTSGAGENAPSFSSQEAIVNAVYALEEDAYLATTKEYTLTGKITKINTPYDGTYGNISVTIVVGNLTDKPIQCYRMKGANDTMQALLSKLKPNDTITVTGLLKDYHGTKEFDAGCKMTSYKEGAAISEPVYTTPEEIVNALYALGENEELSPSGTNKYTLTGKITSVDEKYSSQYENITVTIVVGNMTDKPVKCYRLKGADDTQKANLKKLKKDDTITVNGLLVDFKGTKEFTAGCLMTKFVDGGGQADPEPDKIKLNSVVPEAGKAYKMAVAQQNLRKALYFNGKNSGNFLSTAEGETNGKNVYLEKVTGGYSLYFKNADGSKTYINIAENGVDGSGNQKAKIVLESSAKSVYTINSTYKTLYTNVNGTPFYMGTYNNYDTFSASRTSYLEAEGAYDESQFPAQFIVSTSDDPGEEPDDSIKLNSVVPEAGKTYKLAIAQQKLKKALYFDGGINNSGFLTMVEKEGLGTDVTLEAVTGGYALSFTDSKGTKQYITLVDNGKDNNGNQKAKIALSATADSVYTINQTYKTLYTNVNGTAFYLGTYNTYDTISASRTSYLEASGAYDVTQFPVQFILSSGTTVSDEDKVAYEKGKLTLSAGPYTEATEVTLPVAQKYTEVGITWVSDSDYAKVEDGKLVITIPEDKDATANITATLKLNTVTDTKAFKLTIKAKTAEPAEIPYEVGKAYKFKVAQNNTNVNKVVYFNGQKSGNYLATTENTEEAVDVFLEKTEDGEGYNLYFMNGETKTYIVVTQNPNDAKKAWVDLGEEPGLVFTYNETFDIFETKNGENTYYLGCYNTYTTISASNISYLSEENVDVSQFPARLADLEEGGDDDDEIPYEVGKAYKFKVAQNNSNVNKVVYFNGQKSGNYLATTESTEEAVDVFLEKTEDGEGYNLYFMDGETKTYIVVTQNPNDAKKAWVDLGEEPGLVFTYNETFDIFETKNGDNTYYLGCYNTYTTISASNISYLSEENVDVSQFPARLAELEEGGDDDEFPYEVDKAYKFKVAQNNENVKKEVYFNGQKSGNYLATTEDVEEAVDVFLEEIEDGEGYNLYFMDGETKTYIVVTQNPNDAKKAWVDLGEEPGLVFTYNETYDIFETKNGDNTYYLGCYNTYTTISASNISYLSEENVDVSQFPARLVDLDEGEEEEIPYEVGKAYKFKVAQNNANVNKVVYFNGQKSGNYLATTEDTDEAADVFLEKIEDGEGYNLYFMDGETKTYIVVTQNPNDAKKAWVDLGTEPGLTFTYNETYDIFETKNGDNTYYLGCYNTYTTISASNISYLSESNVDVSQFPARLVELP